jgi:GT2 family glycosyltransferase
VEEPSAPSPGLVVAVLDYNGAELTRRCLASLRPLRDVGATILIVDNAGDQPDSALRLAEAFGDGYVPLRLPSNGGVAGGYTAAMRWADEAGASHVLLLNNDTVLHDVASVVALQRACTEDVAVVGPLVRDETGTITSAGSGLGWTRGRPCHLLRPLSDRPYPTEWVHGSAMLVSLEAYRAIGGLDPTYFMYFEDIDWSVRAWGAGWRCLIEPAATIIHAGSATVRRTDSARWHLRNTLLFKRKHGSTVDHLLFLVYFAARRIPVHVAKNAWPPSSFVTAVAAAGEAWRWNFAHAARVRSWRLPGLRHRPPVR